MPTFRLPLAGAVLALLLSPACLPVSAPFHLYAMDPAAPQQPLPASIRIHFGWQTMTLTATLPDGNTYRGSIPTTFGPPSERTLAAGWDRVYGPGYFNAKVLGSPKHCRATLTSSAGATLLLELHAIPGDTKGGVEGVAQDAEGRLYKAGH